MYAALALVGMAANEVQGKLFSYEALFPNHKTPQDDNPLQAYKVTGDPDTMYHHQAMRERDRDEFRKAMKNEIKSQMANGNFEIVHKSKVPQDATILLSAVW